MPLEQSASKESIGRNIAELTSAGGRPHKQIVAIALSTARKNGAHIPGPPKKPSPANRYRYRDGARL